MDAPPVQYVTTEDGYRIAYAVSGVGTPLLFLPGSFQHVQLAWEYPGLEAWLVGLSTRFQLVQLDPRGTGMSSRNVQDDLERDHYQRDINAVLEKLKLERLILFGVSRGVDWVVDYALRHPGRVVALVFGTSGMARSSALLNALPAEDWEMFLHSIPPRDRSRDEANRIVELYRQAADQRNFLLRQHIFSDGVNEELLGRLGMAPLVLHSRDFVITPVEEAMSIAQHSGGRLVLIDGTDTWGDADQGIRAIESFLADIAPQKAATISPADGLSAREIEVLRLIAAGRSNAQIAEALVISPNTVGRHVSNIFDKTGAANRAEATAYAMRNGLA